MQGWRRNKGIKGHDRMKRTLDDLCELITDGTHQTPEYCGEDGVIFLSSKDVVNRKINWEQVKYIPQSLHDVLSSRLKPQRNDILLAKNGTTGVAALVDCEKVFDIYVSLALLRPKKSINPKFLLHAINSPATKRQFDAGLKGIGVPNLHLKEIKNTTIDVPNENMQSHIVNCLETLDGLHENWIKQLAKLDTLVKSRFIEMFGDPNSDSVPFEKQSINAVCDAIYGGGTPSKSHIKYYKGDIPWVTPKDMKTLSLDDSQDHITTEAIENSTTKLIPINSVLMVIRSGILKHTLPVAINTVEVTINQDMKAFVPSSIIMPEYLLHTFKMLENSILSKVRGVTADNIEFSEFKKRQIPLPPIALQRQFAAFVQQVDKSKSVLQKLLEKQEILRTALMQEYFG